MIQNLTPPSREELAGPYQKPAMVHCNIFSLKKVCRILCLRTNYLLHKVHSRRRTSSRFFRVYTTVLPWITRHNKRLSFFSKKFSKEGQNTILSVTQRAFLSLWSQFYWPTQSPLEKVAEASGARIRVKTQVWAEMRRMNHIVAWTLSHGQRALYRENFTCVSCNNHQLIRGLC